LISLYGKNCFFFFESQSEFEPIAISLEPVNQF
jgi:hypothetical protein